MSNQASHRYSKINKKDVLYHGIFWILIIVFFTAELMIYQPERGLIMTIGRLLFSVIVDMMAAYFTVYFLIPRFIFRKKYLLFALFFILSAVALVYLQRVIIFYVSYPIFAPDLLEGKTFHTFYPLYAFMNIYTATAVFATLYFTRYWFVSQQQKKELEEQNLQSELTLLRSQISPHFLFNTLNNIDSLIFLNQKWASDAVIKLSEILRYMLYEANTDRVPLNTEVSYLKSYVKLQTLRLESEDFVEFSVKGKLADRVIAPMILIPFVENAFKHGLKNVSSPGIVIKIKVIDHEINFEIMNHLNLEKEINKDDTRGIGLANVKRRLSLIYPDQHFLEVGEEGGAYTVKLKIYTS
ncbi:MAG: hypothetical protein DRJ15_11435 [Bacteroidetes bacterium]|nr:MAG: hypothetical protein DRJ15_11435 [Bacteroidota bacterium]